MNIPFSERHPELAQVLRSPPETIEAYQKRVSELHTALSAQLGIPLRTGWSDYSADWIELWIDEDGIFIPAPSKPATRCRLFVCTRGKVATLRLAAPNAADSSLAVQSALMPLIDFLEKREYLVLEGDVLDELVDGFVTVLDGRPARVHEVFFSEME